MISSYKAQERSHHNTELLRRYFPIALIIFTGTFLRLFLLTHQSLWYDEGISLVLSDGDTFQENFAALWSRPGGDKYQPLYYVLLSVWRSLAGDSEFSIRLFSVLPGIASIAIIYLIAKRLYNERHALWSALLIASSAFCIYYSQEVRPYSLQFLLASLQLYLFSGALHGEKTSILAKLPFAVVTAVNFLGGVLLVVFSCALALSHLIIYRRSREWFQWWLPAGIAALPMVIYFLSTPGASNPASDATNGLGLPVYKNAIFSLYGLLVGITYGPPLDTIRNAGNLKEVLLPYFPHFLILLLIGSTLAISLLIHTGLFSKGNTYQSLDDFFLTLFLISFCLAAILAVVTKINWMPRHSFYIYLPLCILLPSILYTRPKHTSLSQPLHLMGQISRLALIGLVVANLYSSYHYFFDSNYWRDDYRSAAQYLVNSREPAEESILLWGTPRLLNYYGDSKTLYQGTLSSENLAQNIADITQGADNIFVAVNREFTWLRN
ncbi:MAG: glycosyltransferase family 39 protein, partial [Cyanobacteria bacterium J06635_15]